MQKYYKALIHKSEESNYGATFADLPGCMASEDSETELLKAAAEAAQIYADAMFENKLRIPEPGENDSEALGGNDDVVGYAIIPVDVPTKQMRVNISIADHILDKADKFSKRHGRTRSGLIADAVSEYMRRHA